MSNPNLHNENDPMSDARLDELLDLAKPKLDLVRQKALRRTVEQTLKSNRPSWWAFFRSYVSEPRPTAIRLLIVGCCLLMLVGLSWLASPNSSRTKPATVAGNSESDAIATPPTLSGSELAKLYPPIISSSTTKTKSNQASKQPSAKALLSKSVTRAQKSNDHLSFTLSPQIENSLLLIAGTDAGLMLVDQFADSLDNAAAKVATNRAALLNSRVRRSEKARSLVELKQQDDRLRFARQRLETYLIDAVERLPQQQATSAFRILCRVGSKSSLPVVLKYRNIEATQADAALAISRMADGLLLKQLVLESHDLHIQSQLMAGLLCRHDTESLDLFLELTAKHDLYSAAQKSGGIAHCVPTEILMQRLQSNRANIARAAAITLSGRNDPTITESLMQLANRPESRWSSVMALTARTDDSAIRFVRLASNDIRWSATVINEKKKWNRILAVN
ncbi:hypothetical protein N9Y42_00425 [Mariniblastus sp.]|nr:hypothetical protein [Mariniblastus sp.]